MARSRWPEPLGNLFVKPWFKPAAVIGVFAALAAVSAYVLFLPSGYAVPIEKFDASGPGMTEIQVLDDGQTRPCSARQTWHHTILLRWLGSLVIDDSDGVDITLRRV
jgi:hypothetical protein